MTRKRLLPKKRVDEIIKEQQEVRIQNCTTMVHTKRNINKKNLNHLEEHRQTH